MLITDADDLNHAILYCLIKLSIVAGLFFTVLIWLFQPIVIENPGIAVYHSSGYAGPVPFFTVTFDD
jgi:hypothetical protein